MPQALSSLAAAAHSAVQCPHRLRVGKIHDELAEPGSRSVEPARPAESALPTQFLLTTSA